MGSIANQRINGASKRSSNGLGIYVAPLELSLFRYFISLCYPNCVDNMDGNSFAYMVHMQFKVLYEGCTQNAGAKS